MAQTTYPATKRSPEPGVVQGPGVDVHVVNAAADMRAGIGVVLAPSATAGQERRVTAPAGAGPIYGITHWQHLDNSDLAGSDVWRQDDPAPVRRQGRIWVETETALDPTDTVFMRHTNGIPGAFRNDNAAGEAAAVTGARCIVGTAGAGVALLEVDFPSN